MDSYQARIEDLNSDISLSQAENIFRTTIDSSSSNLSDPRGIGEELAYLKEFCSKLKFQYLEQETRDKFLRLLLIEDNHNVSDEELDRIVKENVELKQALKQLKSEMENVLESSESTAEDVVKLSQAYQSRRTEVDQALADVENLQNELDSLLKVPENENHVTLFNVKRLIDTEDIGLDQAIEIAENEVVSEKRALSDLTGAIERAQDEVSTKDTFIANLSESLARLQTLVEQEEQKPKQKIEPKQAYAQWLRDLNSMVEKFVPIEIKIDMEKEGGSGGATTSTTISIANTKLKIDRQMNILQCTNPKVTSRLIAEVNCAEEDRKFWRLSQLLSEIIFEQ